jgi:hypothetical protein
VSYFVKLQEASGAGEGLIGRARRDTILTHPTMAEGLASLFPTVVLILAMTLGNITADHVFSKRRKQSHSHPKATQFSGEDRQLGFILLGR